MSEFNIETVAMEIIAHSGDARSLAFNALQKAKKGDFEEAKKLMAESKEAGNKAHQVQTKLLVSEAQGNKNEINILLIHAQDHLMTSLLAEELIRELIFIHESK